MRTSLSLAVVLFMLPAATLAAPADFVFRDYLVYDDFVQTLEGGASLTLGEWDYHDASGDWIEVPRVINGSLAGPGTVISGAFNGMNPDPHWTTIALSGSYQSLELRGAEDDGNNVGRPAGWSGWLSVSGQEVPATLVDMQYLSYRVTLGGGDAVTQIDLTVQRDLRDAHPRLLVDDLADLRARCAGALSHQCEQSTMFANSTHLTDAVSGYSESQASRVAKVMAFEYMMHGDTQHSDRARALLLDLASNDRQHWSNLRDSIQDLGLGWIGLSWMQALDWIMGSFDRQDPGDLADLQAIADGTTVFVDYLLEMYKHVDFNNHFHLGRSPVLLAGIALHDEGLVDADALRYLDVGFDLMFNHEHPGLNVMAGDMGGWHESLGYFDGEMGSPVMIDMDALRTATGLDFFQDSSFWRSLPFWYLSSTVPWDHTLIHWADQGKDRWALAVDGSESEGKGTRGYLTGLHKNLARLGRPEAELAQHLLDDLIGVFYDSGTYAPSYYKVPHLNDVLWYQPGAAASALPNARASSHFVNLGEVILREGTDADDAMAMFACADFRGGHQQSDNGHFSIWYKGYLAVDSGYYDGWGSSHHMNYARRTIAHNTLTITMPGESFTNTSHNDGGQAYSCDTSYYNSPANDPRCDVCDMRVSTQQSPYFDFIAADLTRSYDAAKAAQVQRDFVWLRPDLFIVFDTVESTDASYAKRFLLHGLGPFTASGEAWYVDQSEGRMFARTLLPAGAQTTQIGGVGHEWDVDGTNYTPSRGVEFSGTHRLEISPPSAALRDHFLHVLQVGEQSVAAMEEATLLSATDAAGVQVRDWVVWFGTAGQLSGLSYAVDASASTNVVVGDLAPSTAYQIQSGSAAAFSASSDENGVLSFTDPGSGQHLVTVGDGVPFDAGFGDDAAVGVDAATGVDAAVGVDAGAGADAGAGSDASAGVDAVAAGDAGAAGDVSITADAASTTDAIAGADAVVGADATSEDDAGEVVGDGCACGASSAGERWPLVSALLMLLAARRRRQGTE